ncbi:glutamate 5-kinase [Planctobacterium marinum]|uniref:glutamate 5-kinase n=1 Tax=Planctobacterium marinum TaxID=1631968 RepID=UPI001E45CDFF|nr:glutamate 5-kinase [Planctobacterium marinum]MCC2608135.1 glutamate 5-kinase [Planctobacterium marinum]
MAEFQWQRAVIKIGSALIAPDGQRCSAQYLLAIAKFITESRLQGKEVVLVSSGSVAAGRSQVPVTHLPTIAEKQAMAAIGQSQMMANWARFFDFPCAQILLTYDDLRDRTRYVNIKNTLRELLKHQALPIVNENDSVAVNEIKVGDNDNLAAYTALVAQADTLIVCSDIDGLFDADPRKNPQAKLIPEVLAITPEIHALAGGAGSKVGTGGMVTKLQAAEKCAQSGIQTLIVNGRKTEVFDALLKGQCPGTLFRAGASPEGARAQWLRHTLSTKGDIEVDAGAANALLHKGASLLPSGIISVAGKFSSGEAVQVTHNGKPIAKGLALYSADDLRLIAGQKSQQIEAILGYTLNEAAIHRDDLILSRNN